MSREIKVALLMVASLFMDVMDGTIVTTALPKMAQNFNVSAATISLLVSTYMIAVAVFIPLSGWIAQRLGNKRIWLLAVALFTVSSLGSALAPNFAVLLTMRVIQGIAGAMMTPTARLIVLEKTPANQLLRMISYLVWPSLVAPALAPVIGGMFVTYFTWHWIFLINLPIGIIAFLIGLHLLPKDEVKQARAFDVRGFIELALASVALLAGAEMVARTGAVVWYGLILVVIGILLGVNVFFHLRKAENPLFSVDAMKVPTFRVFQTGGTIFQVTIASLPYVLTVLLQTVFGWTAARAGWYVLFIFVGNIGIKPFTNPIIRKMGFRGALVASFSMLALSSFALALVRPTSPAVWIMLLALISGVGRSLAFTSYNGLQFTEIAPEDRNGANTLTAVTQSMGQGLGISLITVIIHLFQTHFSLQGAYSWGFVVLGVFAIIPMLEILTLPKDAGSEAIQ
ncbi:MFS transporter [Weissella confusa]|uniref:MFS transporter n=1 Tax=Weissella confusa TaxID=1583 RepID=UPI0018F24102|nr:MFS transporter [Weissella confusa]MBJ7649914.1 multidrug efflux MFS transporter [Weissella confusa]MBJ7661790.1 multidrug efflux MFS transporter [Weissella confusa]